MFDAEITIARASGHIILLEHYIRQTREACDKATARVLYNQIETLVTNARRSVKHLERPKHWQYYCRCGFNGKPDTEMKLTCPECGEGLGLRDLDCKTP